MKVLDAGVIILVLAVVVGVGSALLLKKDDGPIEEAAEAIIKQQTGVDVDLTPGSPEDGNK